MYNIVILGSCVSRDIFSYFINDFNVVKYFARTSIISIMSEELPIIESDIRLDSSFQKKMIMHDFNKDFFKEIKDLDFDYLIIDFIDERFNLLKHNNSYITRSNELVNSKIEENRNYKFELIKRNDETYQIWEKSNKLFIDKLKEYVPSRKIILHKAFWAYKYKDDNHILNFPEQGVRNTDFNNSMLEKYYSFLEKTFENINIMEFDEEDFIADKNHKWGLSQFHYEESYYFKALEKIKYCILNN